MLILILVVFIFIIFVLLISIGLISKKQTDAIQAADAEKQRCNALNNEITKLRKNNTELKNKNS